MSYHVRMNVSRDDTGWGVDIWINGAFHDRVPADNEDEAKRMLVALVDMTIEESADWRGGPLGRKELMDSRKAAMVTIQPRQTASGRWAVRTVVEADGQRHEFDTAEGLNEVDAMTNAVKLSEALRALGGPVKLLGAQDDPA